VTEVDVVRTPLGPCAVTMRDGRVCRVRLGARGGGATRRLPAARRWLASWFAGRSPAVPLDLAGVPGFHRKVYDVVRRIPPGSTRTYGEVARAAGRPGAARAVGQAMARNPVPLFIP